MRGTQLILAGPWGAFPAYTGRGFDLVLLVLGFFFFFFTKILLAELDLENDCDNLQHHQRNMLYHCL